MSILASLIGRLPRSWIKAASRAQWRSPALKRAFDWTADRMRSRDGVVQSGIGKGLRFNTGRSNAGYLLGTSEPNVQLAMAAVLRPGMTYYDVGANVGFHAMLAARIVGPRGRVVCFEPFAENLRQIEHNARLNGFNRVTMRGEALGARDGEGRFMTSGEPTWGRLDDGTKAPSRFSGTIKVSVRRLDSVLEEPQMPAPDVIKMDIEGGEIGALAGATATLRKFRPILLIELHGTNAEVAAALDRSGYLAGVLASDASITAAPWDAYVIAVPKEKRELAEIVETLCRADSPGPGPRAAAG